MKGLGFKAHNMTRVQGLELELWGLELKAWGLGFSALG